MHTKPYMYTKVPFRKYLCIHEVHVILRSFIFCIGKIILTCCWPHCRSLKIHSLLQSCSILYSCCGLKFSITLLNLMLEKFCFFPLSSIVPIMSLFFLMLTFTPSVYIQISSLIFLTRSGYFMAPVHDPIWSKFTVP